jgi:hypothetical protein
MAMFHPSLTTALSGSTKECLDLISSVKEKIEDDPISKRQ